jgi:RNA polymerase sigma factor (sigma-70 family)
MIQHQHRLLQAFRNGEDWAFAKIFSRFHRPILRYVEQKVRDEEVAQELVQETFLKIYRHREAYRPEYAFSTWLWTIARNTVLDWNRRGKLESTVDGPVSLEESVASPLPNAQMLMELSADRRQLRRVFGRLTGLQRKVIWMRLIHQLSYAEIARRLRITPTAVKCLAYRSKLALREAMLLPSTA